MSEPAPGASGFLYATAALRQLEQAAIDDAGGDGSALMARAGAAAFRVACTRWPQARRIVVACGPGNNGGDGYVFALHALEGGREVRVVHARTHAPRSAVAQRAAQAFIVAGGSVEVFDAALPPCELLVDAVLGIGLARAPDADVSALLHAINTTGAPVFALDVPSGVDAGSGEVHHGAVLATVTLQFLAAHLGLHTGAALDHTGERLLDTLDVRARVHAGVRADAQWFAAAALAGWFAPRARNSHKGQAGHVLCVGGDHGRGGAVLLAAEAALRSGAGLVSVATRAAHVAPMLARRPEAMAHAVDDVSGLQPLLDAATVIALGPGLGTAAWGQSLYAAALAGGRPLVLDADALNLLARGGDGVPADTVLTPHPGEAARLLGCDVARVQRDRHAAAQALATRFGCCVILKGAGSLVAMPGCMPRLIAAGNPGMAVGGMGDVLTGCVAALRAQGMAPFEAATAGALLHAHAGDRAAGQGRERGLLPSDLFSHLREAVNP
ncbi:bifunctional ADP-dependent NAD(P)H-hydrate dehydratase/NAD(P)H-hydrate epimerase [Lysobacteraceae bacterium NML91-0213]|nr:bifunctional ADP-dependent NAD(P)H-hydrate dehydratase/NAD(P)H-hydrate epimerase [Xanthomonadaceae bacterium NML91-0213]